MTTARVTFVRYYTYEVEVDDEVYEEDIDQAEDEALDQAYDCFKTEQYRPIADIDYDEVEIEFK